MKKIALLAAACALTALLGACNTVSGFGKDVEKTGDAIQRKAQ